MSEDNHNGVVLNLKNGDGNSFAILGRAQEAFKAAKVPAADIKKIIKDATSSDRDYLLLTICDACDQYGIDVQ